MKTSLILFVVVSLSLVQVSWANNCGVNPVMTDGLMNVLSLAGVDCDQTDMVKGCKCLKEKAKSNLFIAAKLNEDNTAAEVVNVKRAYQDQFLDVYKQMTVGASVQAQILGLNKGHENDRVVGCTAAEFSTNVGKKSKKTKQAQKKDLEDAKEDQVALLKACVKKKDKDCDDIKEIITRIDGHILELGGRTQCHMAIGLLQDGDTRKKLSEMMKFYGMNSIHGKHANSIKQVLEAEKPIEEKIKSMQWLSAMALTGFGLDGGSEGLKGFEEEEICLRFFKLVESNIKRFEDNKTASKRESKRENRKIAGAELIDLDRKSQCPENDLLCLAIERKNDENIIEAKIAYDEKPEECVTLAQFQTFKSMPSPELLKELATASNPGDLLRTPTGSSSSLKQDTLRFLRSNPILAKLTMERGSRDALGKSLQKFARESAGKADSGKLQNYLSLLQNDVKDKLLDDKSFKGTNKYICDSLISNFTAIELANDLPPVRVDNDDFPNIDKKANLDSMIYDSVKKCQRYKYNLAATSNLPATLKASPLFTLGQNESEKKTSEDEFDKFKGEVCKGYPEFLKKECSNVDPKDCRGKFLKKMNDNVDNFMALGMLKTTDPMYAAINFAKAVGSLKSGQVKDTLDTEDIKQIQKYTDKNKQDDKFKKWWDENVGSKLSDNVLASKGREEDFFEAQERNSRIASSARIPNEFNYSPSLNEGRAPANIAAPETASAPKAASPQDVPSYASAPLAVPSFDHSRLATAKKPQDAIPNYERLTPPQQKKTLEEVQEFVAREPKKAKFSAKDVEEEIKKVEEKLVSGRLNDGAPVVAVPPRGSGASVSQGQVLPSPVVGQGSFGNSPSFGGGSRSTANSISPTKKRDGRNEELLKIYEKGPDLPMREPASVKGAGPVTFEPGLVDPASIDVTVLANEHVLVTGSHEEYVKIKNDVEELKKFMSENAELKNNETSKVYKIKDPSATPEAYILFHVTRNQYGSVSVKTIDRKSTLSNLGRILGK